MALASKSALNSRVARQEWSWKLSRRASNSSRALLSRRARTSPGEGALKYAEHIFKACAVLNVISRRARETTADDMMAGRTVDSIELRHMREEARRHMRPDDEEDETLGGLFRDDDDDDTPETHKLEDLRMKLTEHYEWWSKGVDKMRVDNMVAAP